MTFLSLYKIVSKSTESVRIALDSDNIVFKVHFQGNPILPGACMVEIAREIIEEIVGKDLKIVRVVNVKFLQIISPIQHPEIVYLLDINQAINNTISAKIQVVSSDSLTLFSKISMELL